MIAHLLAVEIKLIKAESANRNGRADGSLPDMEFFAEKDAALFGVDTSYRIVMKFLDSGALLLPTELRRIGLADLRNIFHNDESFKEV